MVPNTNDSHWGSSKIPRGILRGTLEKTKSKLLSEILRGASVDPQRFQIGISERFQIFYFYLFRYTSEVLQSYLGLPQRYLSDTLDVLRATSEITEQPPRPPPEFAVRINRYHYTSSHLKRQAKVTSWGTSDYLRGTSELPRITLELPWVR